MPNTAEFQEAIVRARHGDEHAAQLIRDVLIEAINKVDADALADIASNILKQILRNN